MEPNQILPIVVMQKAEKLTGGASRLSMDSTTMAYAEFEHLSKQKEIELFGPTGVSIQQIEDLHWAKNCTDQRLYAINNNLSLFGDDVLMWNLDRFTKHESIIHSARTHHVLDVSSL